ncbi:MAG: hypothetical protein JRI97_05975 [Deltaproteobacteria bacterium]|nr:hypothetical protein [Deltaproteobacteria bacterium]
MDDELEYGYDAGEEEDTLSIGIDLSGSADEIAVDTPAEEGLSGAEDPDPAAIATRVAEEVRKVVVKRMEYLVTAAVEEAVIREIEKLKKSLAGE